MIFRMSVIAFFAIGAGAALGAWLRWFLGLMLNTVLPQIPLGTLAANIIGGFLMGIVLALLAQSNHFSPALRLFISTGFLGGLTTFSTFSGEAATLLLRQQYLWLVAHIGVHLVGTLIATLLGLFIMGAIGRSA